MLFQIHPAEEMLFGQFQEGRGQKRHFGRLSSLDQLGCISHGKHLLNVLEQSTRRSSYHEIHSLIRCYFCTSLEDSSKTKFTRAPGRFKRESFYWGQGVNFCINPSKWLNLLLFSISRPISTKTALPVASVKHSSSFSRNPL